MRVARLVLASACLLAAAALLAACGGDSGDPDPTGTDVRAESRPAPPASEFPATAGRSLKEVLQIGDKPAAMKVEPTAMVFYPGPNRYPFGVLEANGTEVTDAEVALYMAPVPRVRLGAKSEPGNKGQVAKAEHQALEQPALGPFPARIESLATDPAFRSEETAENPDTASVIYSARLDFPRAGAWRVAAMVKEEDELGSRLLPGVFVGEFERFPRVGQEAPLIRTNKVDYADVLGKEPIVLLFATPQFCQSRVCGPVVDQIEQAEQKFGDEAAFIHMQIYNQNDPGDGVRPQVRAFHLPSEPWLFAIDRKGIVSDTIEGPFGTELLDEAIEKAIK